MAVQSDETLVTKGDLKTLYTDKILPYLGGNMMLQTSDQYVLGSGVERMIGLWANADESTVLPLYSKTIRTILPNSAGSYTITTLAANINVREIKGVIRWGTKAVIPVCYATGNGQYYCACFTDDSNNLIMDFSDADLFGKQAFVTIIYSKSDDTEARLTAGAYDVNRPDLQPVGKEVFFGNGLYGYKATGVTSAATTVNAGITPTPTKIINHEVTVYGTNQTPVSSGYWTPTNFVSGVYLSPTGQFCFAVCSDYVGKNYTAQVLYTK